jgi:hypothetical protein
MILGLFPIFDGPSAHCRRLTYYTSDSGALLSPYVLRSCDRRLCTNSSLIDVPVLTGVTAAPSTSTPPTPPNHPKHPLIDRHSLPRKFPKAERYEVRLFCIHHGCDYCCFGLGGPTKLVTVLTTYASVPTTYYVHGTHVCMYVCMYVCT